MTKQPDENYVGLFCWLPAWLATLTPSTMNYKFGDIVLIAFSYTNAVGVKKRPALVLYDSGDPDVVVARITSQTVITNDDVVLNDWHSSGLLVDSTVRLHKGSYVRENLISRVLGHIGPADGQNLIAHIKQLIAAL